jgi:hypothetical protein
MSVMFGIEAGVSALQALTERMTQPRVSLRGAAPSLYPGLSSSGPSGLIPRLHE